MNKLLKNNNIKPIAGFVSGTLLLTIIVCVYIYLNPNKASLFSYIMLIPASVALIINLLYYRSIKKLFAPLIRKPSLKSVLFSFLFPLLFIATIAIAVYIFGLAVVDKEKISTLSIANFPINTFGLMALNLLLIFGEEYGWRGFLLESLSRVKGKKKSTIIVGLVWALWHMPVVYVIATLSGYSDNIALLMLVQAGAVFLFSVPFAYSYFMSRSIVGPMIMHLVWNIYNPIVLGDVYTNTSGVMVGDAVIINGEALAGILLGVPFFVWFLVINKN